MLKFRYFQLRLPCSFDELLKIFLNFQKENSRSEITLIRKLRNEIFFIARFNRYISTKMLSPDGILIITEVPTIETYSIKIFKQNKKIFLCCTDPPRGTKFIDEILTKLLDSNSYFFEQVEFQHSLIFSFIKNFNSYKLVSAKIRDFHVYDNAVGRLEVSSQDGLTDEIAPFLRDKHYKIDALTYSVSHLSYHGLIYFSRNGTLRISDGISDFSMPLIEVALGKKE